MYIYVATAACYISQLIVKIGCTTNLYNRRSTYMTGCPPGLTPSCDIEYISVWETCAATREDLFSHEEEIHNYFYKYRLIRRHRGDTEWFRFSDCVSEKDLLQRVAGYMNEQCSWVVRNVPIGEIRSEMSGRFLNVNYFPNMNFLKENELRKVVIDELQLPVIESICAFIGGAGDAGYVIAPCGSGKTRMTCIALCAAAAGGGSANRLIICCPSHIIQSQWIRELVAHGGFSNSDCLRIGAGASATTSADAIRAFIRARPAPGRIAIVTTYMSSQLLVAFVGAVQLIVLDEAHHLTGCVASEEETGGEGITRVLMMRAAKAGVKRLSLTFTPRFMKRNGDGGGDTYLSMDDREIFGDQIAKLKLRSVIDRGVLPDYRVWTLRDDQHDAAGIHAKAECLLEAWDAMEVVRHVETPILHHLIVFAATNEEARSLERYISGSERLRRPLCGMDTLVLRVQCGDPIADTLRRFEEAPRAILINCKVLGEGVDIPVANAVAITYPKNSISETIQMLFRAGRWYAKKSLFHILIPILKPEDMRCFETILGALASSDECIREEIICRTTHAGGAAGGGAAGGAGGAGDANADVFPKRIIMDHYAGTALKDISACFAMIRKGIIASRARRYIQELCRIQKIDTHLEYIEARMAHPELPEDPRLRNGATETWYDFLHPHVCAADRILPEAFVQDIIVPHRLLVATLYDEWRESEKGQTFGTLPSVEHIVNGYFGGDEIHTDFNRLLDRYSIGTRGVRGGR